MLNDTIDISGIPFRSNRKHRSALSYFTHTLPPSPTHHQHYNPQAMSLVSCRIDPQSLCALVLGLRVLWLWLSAVLYPFCNMVRSVRGFADEPASLRRLQQSFELSMLYLLVVRLLFSATIGCIDGTLTLTQVLNTTMVAIRSIQVAQLI